MMGLFDMSANLDDELQQDMHTNDAATCMMSPYMHIIDGRWRNAHR